MKQPLHIIGMGLAAFACLFLVIAIGTTSWMTKADAFTYGIFRLCNISGCFTFSPTSTEVAVRFFVIVGFLMAFTALILSIFFYLKFAMKDVANRIIPLVAGAELVVAGAAVILGAIIFAAKVKPDFEKATNFSVDIGFSFGLVIIGALACFASGVTIILQRSRND